MAIFPEKDLFAYVPKTPLRDLSNEKITKLQLSNQIVKQFLAHFSEKYKIKYGMKHKSFFKVPRIKAELETCLNYLFSELMREKQIAWGSLPTTLTEKDEYLDLFEERKRIALEFVDWLFAPGNRFKQICPGDIFSSHWWTMYALFVRTNLKRSTLAEDWDDESISDRDKRINAFWAKGGGWEDEG